jgi:hypothetical protein
MGDKKPLGTVEERRNHVETLFFMHGLPVAVIGNLLNVQDSTVRDDLQIIRDRLLEKGEACSKPAGEAFEEVAGLLYLARRSINEAEFIGVGASPSPDSVKAKAMLLNTAARCFFYAGRLKQGLDE